MTDIDNEDIPLNELFPSVRIFDGILRAHLKYKFGEKEITDIFDMARILNTFSKLEQDLMLDVGCKNDSSNFKEARVESLGENLVNYLRLVMYEYEDKDEDEFNPENENETSEKVAGQHLIIKPKKMILYRNWYMDKDYIAIRNYKIKNMVYEEYSDNILSVKRTSSTILLHPEGSIYSMDDSKKNTLIKKLAYIKQIK